MVLERWDKSAKVTYDGGLMNEPVSLRFFKDHRKAVILGPEPPLAADEAPDVGLSADPPGSTRGLLTRSILRFAVANGHIPASPTDRLGRGKLMLPLERAKLAPPIEKPADVGRLLAAVREISEEKSQPGIYPFFALLAYAGLRRGEALGLRWTDADLDRRMLTVRRSYDGITKSSKQRMVPVPAELAVILKAYKLADPWKTTLCFPNNDGKMYSRNAKLEAMLRSALARGVARSATLARFPRA
jgi:integrase